MSASRLILAHLQARHAGITANENIPTTTTFLTPTKQAMGENSGGRGWVPSRPSNASRTPPARSKASFRGSLYNYQDNRIVYYESKLERDFLCIQLANKAVAHVQEQPPGVWYQSADGKNRFHTFDCLVTKVDGERIAYALKPSCRVEKSGIRETLALIQTQAPRGFADKFCLRTERHIGKDNLYNAEWVLRARRGRNENDVQEIILTVGKLNGRIRIGFLLEASGLRSGAWNALVNLIDDGDLKLIGDERLNEISFVEPLFK